MVNISVSSITHNRPTVPRDDLSTAPVMTYSGGGGELKVLTAPQQNSIIKRLTSDYSVYNTHSQSIQTFKKAGEGRVSTPNDTHILQDECITNETEPLDSHDD